jgi:hypothetical protein
MGVMIRMKAAGVILVAKKGIYKEANEWGNTRRKKIVEFLKLAREKKDKLLATRVEFMRGNLDTIADALKEQEELIKGINILTAKTSALKVFLEKMKGLEDRIDTFTRMYKEKKKMVYEMLKDSDDDYWDTLVKWCKKDNPTRQFLQGLLKDLFVSIANVNIQSPL